MLALTLRDIAGCARLVRTLSGAATRRSCGRGAFGRASTRLFAHEADGRRGYRIGGFHSVTGTWIHQHPVDLVFIIFQASTPCWTWRLNVAACRALKTADSARLRALQSQLNPQLAIKELGNLGRIHTTFGRVYPAEPSRAELARAAPHEMGFGRRRALAAPRLAGSRR